MATDSLPFRLGLSWLLRKPLGYTRHTNKVVAEDSNSPLNMASPHGLEALTQPEWDDLVSLPSDGYLDNLPLFPDLEGVLQAGESHAWDDTTGSEVRHEETANNSDSHPEHNKRYYSRRCQYTLYCMTED